MKRSSHLTACGQNQAPLGQQHDLPTAGPGKRPNIVFVLVDDQDLHLQSMDYLPLIKKHLGDHGTTFSKHFCTTAVCCPSRVSLWTGMLAHNTNVTDVHPPYGGYPKFVRQGLGDRYLPVWLQQSGYNTYYTGKLFNAHTVDNYNDPFVPGWTGSDFLLDPYTYSYLNATYQRNRDPPVSYEGQYTIDVLAEKAYGFLDDAVASDKPFFLVAAPIAPHSNVDPNALVGKPDIIDIIRAFSAPIPAKRHEHLFEDAKVPRTDNFNPDEPLGAGWIKTLPKQSQQNIDFNDHFYRQRLRSLQSVDELVEGLVERLDRAGILDNTYIFYTSDNGYHIGQHRLNPGKECGFDEDINVPLIIRGPGVPRNASTSIVTTHPDLAPTILELAGSTRGLPPSVVLDGARIPLDGAGIMAAERTRHEHTAVEFWGRAAAEGKAFDGQHSVYENNTYKGLRIVSEEWNLYYSVWCNGEHELYDSQTDPGQMRNLLEDSQHGSAKINGHAVDKIAARLDALLLVLKSCKGEACVRPWLSLHPQGNVNSLSGALSPRFDGFYEEEQVKVRYDRCELGYILESEGPQFETDGVAYWYDVHWSEWT
ncbi:alkaline-phosphatase-like protein [Microdochium bolleyi]|uniref:Arylsulfatase n=1 Tax=Microdochium bolleyi TaxID=196109 RepID=A0A136IVF0_9PEZI|nr:alkaline-phosphatase-like protein [Microdochium bolleyi]